MAMVICSLFDRKSSTYSPAGAYPDTATAQRAFVSLLASPDSTPALWPDDFSLYHLGNFDPCTGVLSSLPVPVCLLTGQSAFALLSDLRRRQGKGGAVGETSREVAPEDSGALAQRSKDPVSPDLPGISESNPDTSL